MYHVLISGYYGFGNCGDDAVLYAITRNLKAFYPDIKITVLSMNPEETRKLYSVESIHRANIGGIMKAIRECDCLLSGGGTLLQDISSTRSILYYLGVIYYALKKGVKVVLYANGIGPIHKESNRKIVKKIINNVDLITLRDEDSIKELESLGINKPPVRVTADPVLTLKDMDIAVPNDMGFSTDKKLVGISLRKWWKKINCEKLIAEYADYIITKYGYDVVFISMQESQDLEIIERVRKLMKNSSHVMNHTCSVEEWLQLIGKLHVLTSMRLHPLIFATIRKVPMIGFNYGDTKVESFLKLVSQPSAGDMFNLNLKSLCHLFDEVVKDREKIVASLDKSAEKLKHKALENDRLVVELLKDCKKRSTNRED